MKRVLLFVFEFGLALGSLRAGEIVFTSYNLENYLLGQHEGSAPKAEHAIAAEVSIIQAIHPDILGVCELGVRSDFEDFKARLQKAGLGYTDSEYVEAADPDRHLALFSRFPISSHQSMTDVPYQLDGHQQKVKRGFLDVTVQIAPKFTLRLIGVHLKSKREVPENEALVRRNEAHLLRQHVDEILTNSDVRLLVYGDFNELRNEPAIMEIAGPRSSVQRLTDLPLKDELGDRWTQYWQVAGLYSRIDYIFVNRLLSQNVEHAKSSVYRGATWNDASDHRPIIATIRTE